jgi:histidine triad (HIT) family protein
MSACPFCNIVTGELESTIIYQDQDCTVLMDIQPINPGHMLVIPNEHFPSLDSLPANLGQHIFTIGQKYAKALRESGIQCEGVNLFVADGKAAMQEVFHFHLHIIPRYEGDGFGFQFSPRYAELPTRDELEDNAYYIRQSLDNLTNIKRTDSKNE